MTLHQINDEYNLARSAGRLDFAEMLADEAPDIPWVLQPMLARGMLTILAGREGSAKSLLAQAIACAVASATPIAGMYPDSEPGRVVILDAENGAAEIHRRVRALGFGGALGMDEKASRRVSVYDSDGFDLQTDVAELQRILQVERPALLVIDSLQSVYFGSEYSIRVARVLDALRELLRQYDCACLLLHHAVKSDHRQIVRGGTKLLSRPEMVYFWGSHPDDSEPGRRMLVAQKQRSGEKPETRWVRIGSEGGLLVIDECAPYLADGPPLRPVRDVLMSSVYWSVAVNETPLSRADVARRLERDAKDRSVGRCLDELVNAGRLVRDDDLRYRLADEPDGGRVAGWQPVFSEGESVPSQAPPVCAGLLDAPPLAE